MTTTTATTELTAPSRTPLIAAIGYAVTAVLTAMGTFWDLTNNESDSHHDASEYFIVLGIAAVGAALVFGLVVRTAATGNPGRRALILSVVGFLSVAVFWAGLPAVIAAGALACALTQKDKDGSFSVASKTALALSAITVALAVMLAIVG
jgi:cytochrome bd-type quinol oxidase subunit 2